MIISHISNPRCNQLAILRIRNAASELRQTQLDLADYIDEQITIQEEFRIHIVEDLSLLLAKTAASYAQSSRSRGEEALRRELQMREAELRNVTADRERIREAVVEAQ